MRIKVFAIIIIIILALAVVIWLVTPSNEETNNANTTNTEANLNTSVETSRVGTVTATSSGFSPATVTIQKGQSVTWSNTSGKTVYVAPDDHPTHTKYAGIWDDDGSGRIDNGESYTFTFTTAGTYTYHDHLNSSETGTIIVE